MTCSCGPRARAPGALTCPASSHRRRCAGDLPDRSSMSVELDYQSAVGDMGVRTMRRLVILIAAGATLAGVAAPGSAVATPVTRVSVRGHATHLGADPPFPRITVLVQASSNADGSNPRGVLTVRSAEIGQRRRGEVTCLDVDGTRPRSVSRSLPPRIPLSSARESSSESSTTVTSAMRSRATRSLRHHRRHVRRCPSACLSYPVATASPVDRGRRQITSRVGCSRSGGRSWSGRTWS